MGAEFQKIIDEAANEAAAVSFQQGAEGSKLDDIQSLMKNTGWGMQESMDALSIPPADQARYSAMLQA